LCCHNLQHPKLSSYGCHSPNTAQLQRSLRLWPLLRESLCNPHTVCTIVQPFPLIALQPPAVRLMQGSVNDFIIDFDQRRVESRAKRT